MSIDKLSICPSDTQKIIHEISAKALGFTYPNESIFQDIFVNKFIYKPVFGSTFKDYNNNIIFLRGIISIFYKGDVIGVFKKKKQEYNTNIQYENAKTSYKDGTYDHDNNVIVLSGNFEKHKEELRILFMNEIYGIKGKIRGLDEQTEQLEEVDVEFLNNMVNSFEFAEGDNKPTQETLIELIQHCKKVAS